MLPAMLEAQKPRERDLELPIGGTPGALDAMLLLFAGGVMNLTVILTLTPRV